MYAEIIENEWTGRYRKTVEKWADEAAILEYKLELMERAYGLVEDLTPTKQDKKGE